MLADSPSTARFASGLLKKVVASAALITVGVLSTLNLVQASEVLSSVAESSPQATLTAANSADLRSLPDGIYLYGQSPRPDQIGSAYMVLRVKNRSVAGAFYMPSSSFDCFQGELRDHQFALTVTNSEEQTHYPYSVPLQQHTLEAKATAAISPLIPVGYHAINQVSDRDRQILATCQANTAP
jgi:hypothetical protein